VNNFGFSQCGVLEIVGRDLDSRGFVLKPGSRLVSAVQALHAARYYPLSSPRYEFIARVVVPRSGCSLNSHISLPYSLSFFSMCFGKSCPLSTTIPTFSAGSLAQPCEPILKITYGSNSPYSCANGSIRPTSSDLSMMSLSCQDYKQEEAAFPVVVSCGQLALHSRLRTKIRQ